MGIPKYFRWITNKHSELIIDPQVDNTSYSLEIEGKGPHHSLSARRAHALQCPCTRPAHDLHLF